MKNIVKQISIKFRVFLLKQVGIGTNSAVIKHTKVSVKVSVKISVKIHISADIQKSNIGR